MEEKVIVETSGVLAFFGRRGPAAKISFAPPPQPPDPRQLERLCVSVRYFYVVIRYLHWPHIEV
jgi:hypothetical protein